MQGDERVVAVGLLHPLHAVAWVGQNLFAGRSRGLVGLGVVGKGRLVFPILHLLSVVAIIIDEIDGA